MELDDMKLAWQSIDRRLEQVHALDFENYKDRKLAGARRRLMPLQAAALVQFVVGVAMILLFVSFWSSHLEVPHLLVSGALLHAYSVMMIISACRELNIIHGIDYAGPVSAIQRKLAQLRAWRIRMAAVYGVTGCFVWIPFVLVACKAWTGVDIYALAPRAVAFLVVIGAGSLLLLIAVRHWLRQPGREGLAKRLADSHAGKSVRGAQAVLDEIVRFEKD